MFLTGVVTIEDPYKHNNIYDPVRGLLPDPVHLHRAVR